MAQQTNRPQDDSPETEAGDATPEWQARVDTLRALIDVAREAKLSELELEQDGIRLSLKSPAAAKSKVQFAPPVLQAGEAAAEIPEAHAEVESEEEQAPSTDEGLIPVVSPMVGIFYRASSPNDPNFVEVGDHVEAGQTVGLVETMKVFNEITSDVDGTVVEIRADNMGLVETGDVLLTVRRS